MCKCNYFYWTFKLQFANTSVPIVFFCINSLPTFTLNNNFYLSRESVAYKQDTSKEIVPVCVQTQPLFNHILLRTMLDLINRKSWQTQKGVKGAIVHLFSSPYNQKKK